MAFQCIWQQLQPEQLVAQGGTQAAVAGTIALQGKVDRVLMVTGKVEAGAAQAGKDEVVLEGYAFFTAIYVGDGEIKSARWSSRFSHPQPLPGVRPDNRAQVEMVMEQVEPGQAESGILPVEGMIHMNTTVWADHEVQVVDSLEGLPAADQRADTLAYRQLSANQEHREMMHQEAELEGRLAPVDRILDQDAYIQVTAAQAMEGAISAQAQLHVHLIYISDEAEPALEQAHLTLPLELEMEAPGAAEGMEAELAAYVGDLTVEVRENEAGEQRVLLLDMMVGTQGMAWAAREQRVLTDALCPGMRLVMGTQTVTLCRRVDQGQAQRVVKETLPLPENLAELRSVLWVDAQALVTDCACQAGSVSCEGVLQATVVALRGEDQSPTAFPLEMPLSLSIPVAGAREDTRCSWRVRVEEAMVQMAGSNQVELRLVLKAEVVVTECIRRELVVQVAEGEGVPLPQGIQILFVRPGQTLWDVARDTAQSIDVIRRCNPELGEELTGSERLLLFGG